MLLNRKNRDSLNNFFTRTITGALFVGVLAGGIYYSSTTFFILFLIILLLSLKEFYDLSKHAGASPNYIMGIVTGIFMFVALFLSSTGIWSPKFMVGIIPLVFTIFIIELYRKQEKPFENIAFTILGLVYVALPVTLFNLFVFPGFSPNTYFPYFLFGLFIIQWANDTGAYIFGVSFGRHRLFERISPKKSWEGAIGGAVTALMVTWALSTFIPEVALVHWLAVGIITVVMGVLGDLVESQFKRNIGIKDSGNILPGHGGMLDRFDSIFFAAPAVFVYLKLTIG